MTVAPVPDHRIAAHGSGSAEPSGPKHAIERRGVLPVLRQVFRHAGARFIHDDIPTAAGATTFYLLLAFFPAVGAFVSLYGLFADIPTAREHLSYLRGFLPVDVLRFVGDEMVRVTTTHATKLSWAFILGLLISIWFANSGVSSIMVGLNLAYQQRESRGFLSAQLVSLAITIGALIACMGAFFLVVAIPILQMRLGLPSFDVLKFLRWPLLFIGSVLMLAAIYRFGPNRRRHAKRRVWFGAGVASVLWLLVSWGFTWYVGHFAHYDRTYGSLGSMVGFLMWIWLGQMMIMFGAELNAELEQLR